MAKLSFNKLGLKLEDKFASFEHNGQTVEIKQYLPIEQKLELVSSILNNTVDEFGFYNTGRIEVFMSLAIIENYTNISFTDKQKENIGKLYDLYISNGIYDDILNCMNKAELSWIRNVTYSTINKIYEYNNSAVGMLRSVTESYGDSKEELNDLAQKINEIKESGTLKAILGNVN